MKIFLLFLWITYSGAKYTPDWNSLDNRPLPNWYDESKFGIFCHWGVYSVPAFRSEWFWWYWKGSKPDGEVVSFMEKNYKPGTTYADFAKDFIADYFDPKEFVETVKSSGARYFVFTSKHHEGFTMWPSRTSWNWNSMDIGPKRDIVGELRDAFKSTDIHFGLYFSQFEWFHPLFIDDGLYNTSLYPKIVSYPQMVELVTKFRPEVVWSDGEWDKSDDYWRAKEFLAWLYNSSPVKDQVVVNDRWGAGTIGNHGGFFTYSDHYDPGKLLSRKWENCMTLDRHSWGNRRAMRNADVLTSFEVIEQLARTVSCNGNLLLNIGPDMHGRIPTIFEDRLKEIGEFINANEEALFNTKPWIHQNDTSGQNIWYTSRYRSGTKRENVIHHHHVFNAQLQHETIIYAWILDTTKEVFVLDAIRTTKQTKITVLGTNTVISGFEKERPLSFPGNMIDWRKVVRRDIIVLKIEFAASESRNPLKD